ARYVVPEINGYLAGLRTSREFVANNREYFNRAREAVMAKITENPTAAAALAVTKSPLLAASASSLPDLNEARDRRTPRGRVPAQRPPSQRRLAGIVHALDTLTRAGGGGGRGALRRSGTPSSCAPPAGRRIRRAGDAARAHPALRRQDPPVSRSRVRE